MAAEARTTLFSGFARSVERFADRPALEVSGESFTFAELDDLAAGIATCIKERAPEHSPPLAALFVAQQSYGVRRRSGLAAGRARLRPAESAPSRCIAAVTCWCAPAAGR